MIRSFLGKVMRYTFGFLAIAFFSLSSTLGLSQLPSMEDMTRSNVITKIAASALQAVVKVASVQQGDLEDICDRKVIFGSGFLISAEGHLVTNNHVLGEGSKVSVLFNHQEVEATLIYSWPEFDIAILKIDGLNLPYLSLGDSDEAEIGEVVLSIGYPFSLFPFVANGIIGAKTSNEGSGGYIYTNALTNPGNSGGPLLNLKGDVIGITSACLLPYNEMGGVGLAIPINQLKHLLLQFVVDVLSQ